MFCLHESLCLERLEEALDPLQIQYYEQLWTTLELAELTLSPLKAARRSHRSSPTFFLIVLSVSYSFFFLLTIAFHSSTWSVFPSFSLPAYLPYVIPYFLFNNFSFTVHRTSGFCYLLHYLLFACALVNVCRSEDNFQELVSFLLPCGLPGHQVWWLALTGLFFTSFVAVVLWLLLLYMPSTDLKGGSL